MNQVVNAALNILVIDDDEVDRMTVRRALKTSERSIHVEEAENASEALEMLKATSFDCAILDYRLPGTDGLSLLKQIRVSGIAVPVIMMTGQGDERLIVEIMKAGATDYLHKSDVTPENLMLSIRNAIRVQRAEQAIRESEGRFRTMADSAPVLLWMADAEGKRLFFNQSWLRFTGHSLEQEIENGWQTAIHPEDLERCLAVYKSSFAARQPFEIEYRLKRGDGEYRWVVESGVPRLTADGNCLGFIGSGIDLTERKRAEQQAQEAIQLREVFLSVASHELKTPLTSLMSNVQLFMSRATRENSLNERDSHTLTVISEQAVRLNKLIGALLDISRLKNGKLSIQREPMDLAKLVRRLVEETRPTLERHTLEFEDFPGALPLLGDDIRLEQVIQNLLQNAIKYSPKGGAIKVKLGTQDGMGYVAVTDQGIGIPQDALPQLFDRFFRAPNAHERNIGGMGLGLYVVKEIVGLHDGAIEVSTTEGQGSTFTMKLPLDERADEAASRDAARAIS